MVTKFAILGTLLMISTLSFAQSSQQILNKVDGRKYVSNCIKNTKGDIPKSTAYRFDFNKGIVVQTNIYYDSNDKCENKTFRDYRTEHHIYKIEASGETKVGNQAALMITADMVNWINPAGGVIKNKEKEDVQKLLLSVSETGDSILWGDADNNDKRDSNGFPLDFNNETLSHLKN